MIKQGRLSEALAVYEELQARFPARAWRMEIARLRSQVTRSTESSGSRVPSVLREDLGIEQVYVVNLDRRPDRLARVLREMNAHGLGVTRVPAVDARCSARAQRLLEQFRSRPVGFRLPSSAHVPDEAMKWYRTDLPAGVFGYLLSQAAVLADARRNGHRRILVFDDDVFFTSDAAAQLQSAATHLPADWKILLLGASEYAQRSSVEFAGAQVPGCTELYHPLAGKTCGSFAVAYDQAIYDELSQAIEEAEGPYDNVALGSLYLKHHKRCFVIDPAACAPDVSESDIRDNARAQQDHSQRMHWEFTRYPTFTAPMTMTVLVDDFATLRYLEQLKHRLAGNTFLNIYYLSSDGLRPVTTGRHFAPVDAQALPIIAADGMALRQAIDELRVPHADIVMRWPFHRLLDDGVAQAVFARALERLNDGAGAEGTIDGVVYCLNAGVAPEPGMHSIVIPCFRGVDHAWPSILSALQQDAWRFEVIVVNDNPAHQDFRADLMRRVDEHRTAIPKGAALRLKVLEHQVNRNGAAARNTGFLRASGEFLSFLDDDDLFEPNRLSAVESPLSSAAASIGACYCGYSGTWNGQRDLSRFVEGDLRPLVLTLRYGAHYMCTNTVTFRRQAFARLGGFNEAYRRHQDLELMTRFFSEYEIAAVPKFCVRNRPSPVPETFVADIPGLCRLKQQFLRDFRGEIREHGDEVRQEVLHAHMRDISKRDKSMPSGTLQVIEAFLRSAMAS